MKRTLLAFLDHRSAPGYACLLIAAFGMGAAYAKFQIITGAW